MSEFDKNTGETEKKPSKWPVVAVRLSQDEIDEVLMLTGESSPGKAVKAAVQEFIKIKGEGFPIPANPDEILPVPPPSPSNPQTLEPSNPTPPQSAPPPQPAPASQESAYIPKLVEAISELTQNLRRQESQHSPAAPARTQVVRTPEQEAIHESLKISEDYFRAYFRRMRAVGQRDATEANEEAFWQYLIAADFCKMDGTPISNNGLSSSFIAWVRNRKKEASEAAERKKAEAEAKSAAEKEEAARKAANEAWNDMMLRSENCED